MAGTRGTADGAWHARPVEEVLDALGVERDVGLSQDEVERRREAHGRNELEAAERRGALRILVDQFASVVILVLAAAEVLALVTRQWPEAVAIAAVLLVNAGIGFVSEWRARRSMEALRGMRRVRVTVRRGGREREVDVRRLVPGDVVVLDRGDLVPADLRLFAADGLRINEAALTGESVPVSKVTDPVDEDAPLADRRGVAFKGTTVVDGAGAGVVAAIGMQTELGNISRLAGEAESEATPLQQKLDRLGRRLALVAGAAAALVALAGFLTGRPLMQVVETGVALGVAAIPEGLPIVATIALARGMWVMARRQALINRLPAVETLGATRLVFTDKTGTLTENRMRLQRVTTSGDDGPTGHDLEDDGGPLDQAPARRALEIGVLCNGAELGDGEEGPHGDPTEIALLEAGAERGLIRPELLEERPEVRVVAFDPDVMMMATVHAGQESGLEVAVKGAPEAVLEVCDRVITADGQRSSRRGERALSDEERRRWEERAREMADQGLRVLAVADKRVESEEAEPYEGLRLVGLVGLHDPPREGVREALRACLDAGIRVNVVTGDQAATALAIAREVGLGDDLEVMSGRDLRGLSDAGEMSPADRERVLGTSVFARLDPEQKLDLVGLFQDEGEVVAMTGDGVNDAPALRKADIGIAMGRRGTDAARQVADMVLRDDAFSSIVAAVEQGRVIFGNIRRAVMFMLCTNGAEIVAVAAASFAGIPLPLTALQILYLNVLTDVFPALALGVGEGDARVMRRPPRAPGEPVLTRRHWLRVGGWSVTLAVFVLGGLLLGLHWLGLERSAAVTVSFLTLGFAKLAFTLTLGDDHAPLREDPVLRNPWVWGSFALCVPLLVVALYVPPLADVLRTETLGLHAWALVLGLAALPSAVWLLFRVARRAAKGRQTHKAPAGRRVEAH